MEPVLKVREFIQYSNFVLPLLRSHLAKHREKLTKIKIKLNDNMTEIVIMSDMLNPWFESIVIKPYLCSF